MAAAIPVMKTAWEFYQEAERSIASVQQIIDEIKTGLLAPRPVAPTAEQTGTMRYCVGRFQEQFGMLVYQAKREASR